MQVCAGESIGGRFSGHAHVCCGQVPGKAFSGGPVWAAPSQWTSRASHFKSLKN